MLRELSATDFATWQPRPSPPRSPSPPTLGFCPGCVELHPTSSAGCPQHGRGSLLEIRTERDMTIVQLGDYRIGQPIARGNSSMIFEAIGGDDLVVKVRKLRDFDPRKLRPELASHYLPRIVAIQTIESWVYVVMQRFHRAPRLLDVRLTDTEAFDCIDDIARALQTPHEVGWTHGQLTPRKILIAPENLRDYSGPRAIVLPSYRIDGRETDDLQALGKIHAWMLTGQHSETPLHQLRPDLDEVYCAMVDRSRSPDSEDRPSLAELCAASISVHGRHRLLSSLNYRGT